MTTGSTEEKPDDRALAPVSGSGLLARYGDLVLLYAAQEGDDERTAEVLDAIAAAAGGDGRRLGRRLASLLLTAGNQDNDFPPLAAFGPVGDGVAVIVHGAAQVSVVTDDGEIVLDGRDALNWVDRMIPAPARVIRGALDTLGDQAHDPWSRLDAGVVRAAGFVFGAPSAIAAAPAPAGAPAVPVAPVTPMATPVPTTPAAPPAPVRSLSAVPAPPEPSQPEPYQPESSPQSVPPPTKAIRREPTSPSIAVPSEIPENDDPPQRTEAYDPFAGDSAAQPLPPSSLLDVSSDTPSAPPPVAPVPMDRPAAPDSPDAEPAPSRGAASVQRGGYEPPAAFSAPPVPTFDDPWPPVPTFDDPLPPAPPGPFGGDSPQPPPPPPPPGAYDNRPMPPAPFGDTPPDGPVHTPTGPSPVLPDQPTPDSAVRPSSAPPAPQQGFDPAAPFEAVLLIGDQAEVEDRSQTSGPLPPADVQPPPGPVPADGAEEADARPIVLGIYCKNDHFNDPRVPYCAVCGISMAQLTHVSRTGPRPPLGLLVLDDGATFRLDTDYVVGREPERDDAVLQGRARSLRIDDPKGVVSRIHARIELDGWDVNVVDLASANGTHIAPPNSESWTRLEAHRKVTLTPGTRVVFGRRGFRYESHRNP